MNKNFIRIISRLDIKNNNLIKGINLEGLRILGEPLNFANIYSKHGVDEICYVDNVATLYGTNNLSKFISNTAKNLNIPLSVGGGIRSVNDIEKILVSGADKVCINSAIVDNIDFLSKIVKLFGSSTITVIIEYIKYKNKYFISKSSGRDLIHIDPITWSKKVEDAGAGEIILTSINNEGLMKGFDIEIIKRISSIVRIPVIAHGGAGSFHDILDVISKSNISGVSIASFFHYHYYLWFKNKKYNKIGNYSFLQKKFKKNNKNLIFELKKFLIKNSINVRHL